MNKSKSKLAFVKAKIKAKFNKVINIKANNVADLLTILAFFIVFLTTYTLNKSIGMYVLATQLLILSYFVARK